MSKIISNLMKNSTGFFFFFLSILNQTLSRLAFPVFSCGSVRIKEKELKEVTDTFKNVFSFRSVLNIVHPFLKCVLRGTLYRAFKRVYSLAGKHIFHISVLQCLSISQYTLLHLHTRCI